MRTLNALGIAAVALLVANPAAAQRTPETGEPHGEMGEPHEEMQETREEMQETREGMHETREGMRETREGMRETREGMRETREGMREAPRPEHMTMEQRRRMEQQERPEAARSLAHLGPLSDWGAALSIGGGVYHFTDDDTRDFTDLGGTWELRLTIGTERVIAFDIAYIGGAQDINAIGLDDDAIWLANGVEGGLRIHFFNDSFKPYLFTGAAYKRYDLVREDRNTSNLQDDEQVLEIPAGLGFAVAAGNFLFDVRGTIRPAVADDGLFRGGDDQASLHNWRVRAALGGRF